MRETTTSLSSIGPRGAGIREVARLSGVSIATVSRVFNDAASVSPETRQRVLERAEALGYAPSSLGRNLVRGRSELLGLIVPNVSFPLYGEMIGGIEAVLGEQGMSILLASSHDDAGSELTATQHLLRHAVDGGIVINSLLESSPPALRAVKWVQISPEHAGLPFRVELDNAEGGRLAALELLRVGRRQLAYLGAPGRESQERERGFAETLGQAGLTYRRAEGDYSERSGTWAADTLLEGGGTPDAIFVAGDLMAAGVLRALHRRGLQVPGDVAVVGFDDAVIASLLYPRLTSVRQPARTMGAAAAELSLRLIAGLNAESVTFAPELVRRESTGPP
ncbi:LacI family DNA-binding transcriptional regulator [Deinococcus humi]|uniref:LacI family transcriptional regulator n=1 Tax=Deinococcus humi TaxID=662880 RepID=A0A7W8JW73_9DEIO|nr:LacI family DNA-binding transcriptional regulator [Deinococcus humi]MBB5364105.1 LacI family transcriptional regulator [Deinococcus humi]GGO32350.1 LacI family transcriptional regulator [Deinococcus humi]